MGSPDTDKDRVDKDTVNKDAVANDAVDKASTDSTSAEKESLDALKSLLIQPETDRLAVLENRLDDVMTRANEISRSLPEAVSLSVMEGDRLTRVIQPVIDDSLKESVRKNPKALADAIFPALGPGIRKAITATIMGMIQSLNQVLNHSFSIQGLKWRFEAFRTGRQFAEVVMLNTLVYQVEQIFLVHGDTGIVLEHVVAEGAMIQDPDLVSGMLTAIQDFVRDSFSTEGESEADGDLDTLRIGSDRSVWVEKGEHAFLAAVLRGTPPVELRTFYQETVEDVHLKAGAALASFDGDTQPFAIFRETLNTGLRFQEKEDRQQISPVVWLIVALIVTTAVTLPVYWGYRVNEARQEWEGRLTKIRDQKGVIVVSVDRDDEVYRLNGLKDPLVTDPLTVLTPEERSDIRGRWQPFYSLDPAFVFQRAQKLLAPPQGVQLSLEQNTLTAKGEANQDWINAFKAKATVIPGIDAADGSALVNTDRIALLTALKALTSLKIYFENDSTELIPEQEDKLNRMIDTLRRLNRQMTILNRYVQVTIVGHADSSGTEKHNLKLSRERAEKIYGFVKSRGLSYGFISTIGVGNQVRLKEETGEEDRKFNRAVSFRAKLSSQNDNSAIH